MTFRENRVVLSHEPSCIMFQISSSLLLLSSVTKSGMKSLGLLCCTPESIACSAHPVYHLCVQLMVLPRWLFSEDLPLKKSTYTISRLILVTILVFHYIQWLHPVCMAVLHIAVRLRPHVYCMLMICTSSFPSLLPRPCACVAQCETSSRRRRGLVHHVIYPTAYVITILLRINDVIGWASEAFYIESGSQRSQWLFVCKLS